jgi:two-component system, OmpR family, phosphate regulon sensor histidine kinase PhoR
MDESRRPPSRQAADGSAAASLPRPVALQFPGAGTAGHRRRLRAGFLGTIGAQMWAGGLVVGGLLTGGVIVAAVGAVHQQQTINALTQVVQPLQVANTELRSGFSQCQTWYLGYRLTGRGNYLGAYRTCGADLRLTLDSTVRLARLAQPALVPLIVAQQRAAQQWFSLADRGAAGRGPHGGGVLGTRAVNASVRFFATNAVMQQRIDQGRAQAAQAGRNGLAAEIRFGGIFVGVVLVSMVVGVMVVVRSVVRPLAGLTPTLARLAAGDHTARSTVTRPAEIAVVAESINNLAEEGERLRQAEQEHARLRALAREAGIRIRANLHANEVISEALTAFHRDLGSDLAFLMLLKDGRLDMPVTHAGDPADELFAQVPEGAEQWPRALLERRVAIVDLSGEHGQQIPAQMLEPLLRRGYTRALVLPVAVGDEPLGLVVGLRKDGNQPWRQVEIDAAEWIAADLGRGLKHAQMYEAEGELVERFRSLDQAKTDFMATVSHELRTPLTSIAGYVEILMDGDAGPVSAQHRAILETIGRNATRLRNLIEDVLTLSKIETGAFRTVMQPVRVAEVISSAVAAVSPAASKGRVALVSEVADPALTVDGDEGQLDRVLINLLANSIKFTPPGGTVAVWAGCDGDTVTVRITDTGIGIPDQDKKDLFSRFFRASNAVRSAVQGTGLGLSIVRTIVANHGGELDLESAEGKGTTVTIRFTRGSAGRAAEVAYQANGGQADDQAGQC